ncbi:exodeoxyribonuclease VII large subunit [Salinibaculum rarum]|uniref:exodeoxyribonuclease VII large subunit n=1 Tax=Salinibaculum rarum TaxID=3058903 RepID=UPI00265EFC80|nr:exodeoxyribonuclease VII large subunit [Salinibaculum sp. KK48]
MEEIQVDYMGADDADATITEDTPVNDLDGEVLSVGDLNSELADIVESDAPHFDFLVGDCSDRYISSADHLHFDLVHNDSTLHCIVFSFRRDWLTDEISEDSHLAVSGDLSYYAEEGQVSVVVEEALEIGDSEYGAIYQENRDTLADDGLLDSDAKVALPEHPTTIGLVTSAESDARKDAITSLQSRYPEINVVVQDTPVQGDAAMGSLLEAISELDRDAEIDVIVVTRGGGADKHLRVFNELPLCRVIAGADTPTVAAIGHENDTVLAGEVADARAMTPTHVGETVLTHSKDDVLETVKTLRDRTDTAYTRHVAEILETAEQSVNDAYQSTVTTQLNEWGTAVEHEYETVVKDRITTYEQQVAHAYQQCEQQHEHAAEKETYQRRQKILAALVILLVLVILGLIFLLF